MRRLKRTLLIALVCAGAGVGLSGCIVAPAPGYYSRPYYRPYNSYYAPRPYRYW